jgi:hypothetical protein
MLISVSFQSSFVNARLSTVFFWRVDRLLQGVDCFALLIDFPMVYILFLCFRYSNIKERNQRLVGRDLGPALHLLSGAEAGSIVSPSPNLCRVSETAAFYSWAGVRVKQQHLHDCNIFECRLIWLCGWRVLGLCADKSSMVSENKVTAAGPWPWHTSTIYRILWFVNPRMPLLLNCVHPIKWFSCRLSFMCM